MTKEHHKVILGFDQSISSSGVVILIDNEIKLATTIPTSPDMIKFYKENKFEDRFKHTKAYEIGLIDMNGVLSKKRKDLTKDDKKLLKTPTEERIEFISDVLTDLINEYDVDAIGFENISYGSAGMVITLARLLGNLERTAVSNHCYVQMFEPTSVKKFAGGGRFKKEDMELAVPKEDLETIISLKYNNDKLDDIVDAYWISKMFHVSLK